MRIIEKPWGVTRRIECTGVWHASIRAGGRSSCHLHPRQDNRFYVVSGTLIVSFGDGLASTPVLHAGNGLTVPAGVQHQFVAVTDVELIEVYEPLLDVPNGFEIERLDDENIRSHTCTAELDAITPQGASADIR